ncbi:ATP-binding protein [Telmatospirillum sp.]|uniref:sensor histidine kinase n=1 Tax=Telmatospirillum sp. TaxID=2079197 RepID=UPI002848F893|nr:ATP-binding protein [Telmatospirillum sp.]MDR3437479.1 ATP-binding protein [Telmatospirillum sp.]
MLHGETNLSADGRAARPAGVPGSGQPERWRWPLLLAGIIVVLAMVGGVSWKTTIWAENQSYARLAEEGRDRLILYGAALHSEVEKSRNIPLVLASDPSVVAILGFPPQGGGELEAETSALNRRLQALNESLATSAIYLLDDKGLTLAASNWNDGSGSFVGQKFDFRPYFLAAMQGQPGRYFALGSTSNRPGYYIAMPVRRDGRILGVVVVKTAMDDLEHGWSGGGEKVFVADHSGIVFLTNVASWRFRTAASLDHEARLRIDASRQYGEAAPLAPLDLQEDGLLASLDGNRYVMVSQVLPDGDDWTLHVFLNIDAARAQARNLGFLTAACLALAFLIVISALQRARLMRLYTRDLEQRVAERTAALVDANHRLQSEVAFRQRAEVDLTAKQEELVQATKLAALGQMSAGMVHEINQPLTALRSYADNAVTLLGLGRSEQVRDNLAEIAGLTERIARITGQLKQFARKSTGAAEPVAVRAVTAGALSLIAGRLRNEWVELSWEPPADDVMVWGDDVRLQQVLINILRNALDAMRGQALPRLSLTCWGDGDKVWLAVADNGPGIPASVMPHIFDPFFTTKAAGEGLGLGLSISEGIIRDLGGQLTAADGQEGGAVFTITLRRA